MVTETEQTAYQQTFVVVEKLLKPLVDTPIDFEKEDGAQRRTSLYVSVERTANTREEQ